MRNPYIPLMAEIRNIKRETSDVKTIQISPTRKIGYLPGQFLEISVLGIGEVPISITSSPTGKDLEISVKSVGMVTERLHQAEIGDKIGIRGPYGNGFPVNEMEGKDVLFIGGGIGLAPLRSLINFMFDNREKFGKISILYGARTPQDLVFKDDLGSWKKKENAEVHLTVDKVDGKWKGNVGVVPKLLENVEPDLTKTLAVVCGPPIMIRFTIRALIEKGFKDEQIIFTLERMMKCGIGKCGHCNIGGKYVCTDGPVFSYAEMKDVLEFKI
jgi:sulfhydrogenase subunit gamma (sulfur reductase)